jgi:hypothetical protein
MTLEEIERESAKLSEAERAALAARLLGGRDLAVPEVAGDEADRCVCPSCQKLTKRIEIEVDAADWARVHVLGSLAPVYPDKERARVCEHCGHVFDRVLVTNPVTDWFVQFMFYAIPAVIMIGVIVILVAAMIEK